MTDASGRNGDGGRAGVLFDLDGTLVDTNYLHTLAWSRALDDVGNGHPCMRSTAWWGWVGTRCCPSCSVMTVPAAEQARTPRYRELIDEARVFPGARELVAALHASGLTTALATSSPSDEVDQLLGLLGIADDRGRRDDGRRRQVRRSRTRRCL